MKQFAIEESIIAYFDGRLSDDESAELLHRVSVSPEIRQIFREHEMLSAIARNAARNVAVRPEVESAVFKNIAALQEEERSGLAPIPEVVKPSGSRRLTAALALLVLLLAGSTLYYGLRNNANTDDTASAVGATEHASVIPNSQAMPASGVPAASAIESNTKDESPKPYRTYKTYKPEGNLTEDNPAALHSTSAATPSSPLDGNSPADITSLASAPSEEAIFTPGRPSLNPLVTGDIAETMDRFELSIGTALSGFNTPADEGSHPLVSDYNVRLGYFLSPNDQIGLRVTAGQIQSLVQDRTEVSGIYSSVTRSSRMQFAFAEELYYLRRFDLPSGQVIDLSAGGGLFNEGWLATVDGWLKFPVSNSVLAGVGFSLSRVHSNAPTAQQLMEEESSMPVIVSGSDVRNTMNGRLQFGLSYRF